MMNKWPPDARAVNYRGPYPIRELHQARGVLIHCLQNRDDTILQSILPKIGIDMPNGCVFPSSLPPIIRDAISPFPTVNGHHRPEPLVKTPNHNSMAIRHIQPLLQIPIESPRPVIFGTPRNHHSQNADYHERHAVFPSDDDAFAFNFGNGNKQVKPLLPTPSRYVDDFTGDNSFSEKSMVDFNFDASSGDGVSSSYSMENHNDAVDDQNEPYEVQRRLDTWNEHFNHMDNSNSEQTSAVNVLPILNNIDISKETLRQITSAVTVIPKVNEVDISSDALRQILALVGQPQENPVGLKELPYVDELPQNGSTLVPEIQSEDSELKFNSANSEDGTRVLPEDKFEECDMYTNKAISKEEHLPNNTTHERQLHSLVTNGEASRLVDASSEIRRNDASPEFHVFKCDYCRVRSQSAEEMSHHLSQAKHISGSKYSAKQAENGQLELVYTQQMMAVKNPVHLRNDRTVVACPDCKAIFDDIFLCSQHCKHEHDGTNAYYAVCPVIHSEFVPLEEIPACFRCQEEFTDWSAVYDHWISSPTHCPFTQPDNQQIFNLFVCLSCGQRFSEDFTRAAEHFAGHLRDERGTKADDRRGIETKHVMMPMRKEKQLDFSPCLNSNSIYDEMLVLQKLCSNNWLKTGLSSAEARIAEIQNKISIC